MRLMKKMNSALMILVLTGQPGLYAATTDPMAYPQTQQPMPTQSASPAPQAAPSSSPIPNNSNMGIDSNPLSKPSPSTSTPASMSASPAPAANQAPQGTSGVYKTNTQASGISAVSAATAKKAAVADPQVLLTQKQIIKAESELDELKVQKAALFATQQTGQMEAMVISALLTRVNNPNLTQSDRVALAKDVNTFMGYAAVKNTTNPGSSEINMIAALLTSKMKAINAKQQDLIIKITRLDIQIQNKQDEIIKLKQKLMILQMKVPPSGLMF